MREKRTYSDEEKAAGLACLDANGGDIRATARQTGIAESTVRGWAKRPEDDAQAAIRAEKKKDLADTIESLVWRMLKVARQKDKIASASLSQLCVGIGIGIDKLTALRNKPLPPPQWATIGDIPLDSFSSDELADIQDVFRRAQLRENAASSSAEPDAPRLHSA